MKKKEEQSIELLVYLHFLTEIKEKKFEIYESEFMMNEYIGNIKYFGNSTVEIQIHRAKDTEPLKIELFLDNEYKKEDEILETDKKFVLKELDRSLKFIKKKGIAYFFNYSIDINLK
jgi:hypothetical protein